MRPAELTARTIESPGCFASLRSEQGAAPLATFARLSLVEIQADTFRFVELNTKTKYRKSDR